MNIEEVFRKLRPVMGEQLDMLWQEYLISDTATRQTIERMLRDSRGWPLAGGTLQMQKIIIASTVLGRRFDQRK